MGDRYFVRSASDAPEKGPFSAAQLQKSHDNALLGATATARREDSDEWRPLKDVVASLPRKAKRARSERNDEHALASAPRPRGANALVWYGVVIGLAGVALTVGFAATRTEGSWPVALIIVGVVVAVRGVIRGPERDEGP